MNSVAVVDAQDCLAAAGQPLPDAVATDEPGVTGTFDGVVFRWRWGAERRYALLLHGIGHHGRAWDDLATCLRAAGLSSIAPELPGHGRSVWRGPRCYRPEAWAAAVAASVADAGPPALVVGHSLGSVIALELADAGTFADVPTVLIEPPLDPLPFEVDVAPLRELAEWFPTVEAYAAFLRRTHPLVPPHALSRLAVHGSRPAGDGGVTPLTDPRVFALEAPAFETLTDQCSWRTAPTLVLRGAYSGRCKASSAERFTALHAHTETATITAAGHSAHLDNHDAFAAAIARFVRHHVDVG